MIAPYPHRSRRFEQGNDFGRSSDGRERIASVAQIDHHIHTPAAEHVQRATQMLDGFMNVGDDADLHSLVVHGWPKSSGLIMAGAEESTRSSRWRVTLTVDPYNTAKKEMTLIVDREKVSQSDIKKHQARVVKSPDLSAQQHIHIRKDITT